MHNSDKKRFLDMQEHPENYSKEKIEAMIDDFDQTPDIQAAWQEFENRISADQTPAHITIFSSQFRKVAAVFVGILLTSGIALAAIHFVQKSAPTSKPYRDGGEKALMADISMDESFAYAKDDLIAAGWTAVDGTTVTLTDVDDYYYLLVDGFDTNKSLAYSGVNTNSRPVYQVLYDPTVSIGQVWKLEADGDKFKLKAFANDYYYNSGPNGWDSYMGTNEDHNAHSFVLKDGKYHLLVERGWISALGPWDSFTFSGDGIGYAATAGNCAMDGFLDRGFYIYRIARTDFTAAPKASENYAAAGWMKVETTSDWANATRQYVFLDISEDGYESQMAMTGTDNGLPQYRYSDLSNDYQKWTTEVAGEGYALRNVGAGKYSNYTAPWGGNMTDDQPGTVFIASLDNGKWVLKNTIDSGNWLGRWGDTDNGKNANNDPFSGEQLAANKGANGGGRRCFIIYAIPSVVGMAEALPASGDMEAGKWYYFDNALAGDDYAFTATALNDIECIAYSTGAALTLTATGNSLEETRYYVKSSTDNKLTFNVNTMTIPWKKALADAKVTVAKTDKMSAFWRSALETVINTYDEGKVDETSQAALDAAVAALTAATEKCEASIVSYAIIATGSLPNNSIQGWAETNNGDLKVNTWSNTADNDGAFRQPFIENWRGNWEGTLGEGKLYFRLEGLEPGEIYYVEMNARACNEANNNLPVGSIFYVNSSTVDFTTVAGQHVEPTWASRFGTVGAGTEIGTDGVLEFGLETNSACNYNWHAVKDVKFMTYNAYLLTALNAATAVSAVNVGDGIFQIPVAGADAYTAALADVQKVADDTNATLAAFDAAKSTLETAVANYNTLELNAPDADKTYNWVVATAGHAKENNPIIILKGTAGDNNPTGYAFNANFEKNDNLCQAFTFTKVDGNNYKISTKLAGEVVYLTNGTANGSAAGWADYQIQGTTDADKALIFRISVSTTDGAFNIYNTATNSTIACQDGGNIYTEADNADFKLVETDKPSITINTTVAGWGTTMLPFDVAALPAGVKAYSCTAVDNTALTLVEVTALEANKPYIISGAWDETLSGDVQGAALEYTEGLLTGTYADVAAPVGSYVLQNQSDKVGFFHVEDVQPKVRANHAYLQVDSAVKAFFLDDTADSIKGVFDGVADGDVYDFAGRKVQTMQNGGTYIIGGRKVIVK